MSAETCSACGHAGLAPLMDWGRVPRSGQLLPAPNSPVSYIGLRYGFCRQCGLIRQDAAQDSSADYSAVDRGTAGQMPAYRDRIMEALHARVADPIDDLIIEVGANDGSFLDALAAAGFQRRLGVEPSRTLAEQARHKGHDIDGAHLTTVSAQRLRERYGAAAAVICRHTLEHVPAPLELVAAMTGLLRPGGVLFIEVPSSRPLLERLQVYELWDEHLSIFSQTNLSALVRRAGCRIDHVEELAHRDGANILLWARPGSELHVQTVCDDDTQHQCANLHSRWQLHRAQLHRLVSTWSQPVYALGASHPQSNFLMFSGLGQHVNALIDDDPRKTDRFVPLPEPTPVMSSSQALATSASSGTLLLTGFGHDDWMRRMRAQFSARGFTCIAPYPEAAPARALPIPA